MPLDNRPGPGQFSQLAQQVLDQEKARRLLERLGDEETWAAAWQELAQRGPDAIPVLLEGLERREARIRHLAFRLLEQITGEPLTFQADAPAEVRLRQAAHLRVKLERRKSA